MFSAFHELNEPTKTPIWFLDRISTMDVPRPIADADHIELLRVLQIGGAVRAMIPAQRRTLQGFHQEPALLLEVTSAGRRLLRSFCSPRSAGHNARRGQDGCDRAQRGFAGARS
jgi:hypothetical protein